LLAAVPADTGTMNPLDWDHFDLAPLAEEVRASAPRPDAEKMIWGLERALQVARIDPELLDYLLAAAVCLVARRSGCSPRDVLESFFRRSVPDEVWRGRYLPLIS
jgi:hypothetical protein